MIELVCIDGNNLVHAMHADAPMKHVGRETMVKIIEQWAESLRERVVLVFDGPTPRGGLGKQMDSNVITVLFSGSRTADDVIVDKIHAAPHPERVRVITSDKAIIKEARYRRCSCTASTDFVHELFSDEVEDEANEAADPEKPTASTPEETREWLEAFGFDEPDEEPFEGFDRMSGTF